MTSQRDIWAAAQILIDNYGDAAGFHAASRADEMLARGDVEGQSVWIRILHAVEELQRLPDPAPKETGAAALRALAAKLIEMFGADAERYAESRAMRLEAADKAKAALVWRGLAIAVADQQLSKRKDAIH